jgi:hypothetical protein
MENEGGMRIVSTCKQGVYFSCGHEGVTGICIFDLNCNFPVFISADSKVFDPCVLVPHNFSKMIRARNEAGRIVVEGNGQPLIARRNAINMLSEEIVVNFPKGTNIDTLALQRVSADVIDNGCFSHLALDLDGGSYESEFMLLSLDCVVRGGKVKIFALKGEVKRIIASGDANISIRSVASPALHVEVSGCATVKIPYYHGEFDQTEGLVRKLTVIATENGKAIIAGKEYTKDTPEGRTLEQPQS